VSDRRKEGRIAVVTGEIDPLPYGRRDRSPASFADKLNGEHCLQDDFACGMKHRLPHHIAQCCTDGNEKVLGQLSREVGNQGVIHYDIVFGSPERLSEGDRSVISGLSVGRGWQCGV
jgi:hypothetical protein